MRILVKAYKDVYIVLQQNIKFSHCAFYYPFLFRDIFRRLGYTAEFFGETAIAGEVVTDIKEDDILFYWGLESIVFDREWNIELLKKFQGKKVLYVTAQTLEETNQYFTHIIGTECDFYNAHYQKNYPHIKSSVVPFASPLYDFVDENNTNPYNDDSFKIIYTGIVTTRYLKLLNKLSEQGENIYIGGIYHDPAIRACRTFTEAETKKMFPSNTKFLSPMGNFIYGNHFNYLKYADLGINFYPAKNLPSRPINSKIIDYLVCGLPIVSEGVSPNSYRIKNLNAGLLCEWNSEKDLYEKIQEAKTMKFDRANILTKAREIFNPLKIGEQIIKEIA